MLAQRGCRATAVGRFLLTMLCFGAAASCNALLGNEPFSVGGSDAGSEADVERVPSPAENCTIPSFKNCVSRYDDCETNTATQSRPPKARLC
jgi:hypothetical protein